MLWPVMTSFFGERPSAHPRFSSFLRTAYRYANFRTRSYMEPKHAEVSPLEELDGIVVVLHVFENHFSVLRINISGKCLT